VKCPPVKTSSSETSSRETSLKDTDWHIYEENASITLHIEKMQLSFFKFLGEIETI
jgi:hypothetical protein